MTAKSSLLKMKHANNITGDIQQLCEALWEVIPEGDGVSSDKLKAALELTFARFCSKAGKKSDSLTLSLRHGFFQEDDKHFSRVLLQKLFI
jgi:hypothetical protein